MLMKQSPMLTSKLLQFSQKPTVNAYVKTKIIQIVS